MSAEWSAYEHLSEVELWRAVADQVDASEAAEPGDDAAPTAPDYTEVRPPIVPTCSARVEHRTRSAPATRLIHTGIEHPESILEGPAIRRPDVSSRRGRVR